MRVLAAERLSALQLGHLPLPSPLPPPSPPPPLPALSPAAPKGRGNGSRVGPTSCWSLRSRAPGYSWPRASLPPSALPSSPSGREAAAPPAGLRQPRRDARPAARPRARHRRRPPGPALAGCPGRGGAGGNPSCPDRPDTGRCHLMPSFPPQPICPMVTLCRKKSGWLPLRQRRGCPDPDGEDGLPSAPLFLSPCSWPAALQACWKPLPAPERLWAQRRCSWSAAAGPGTTSTEGTPAWRK
ncbi:translation initiation factor IF-2-like [Manacus candei]|uniref:translation initiation factor IF-2-like n=1 Tax=Manacus candei TaxID=415023 RepID=UPI002226981C|nr:translation initiation factor IF-2-like [Manacus candei]